MGFVNRWGFLPLSKLWSYIRYITSRGLQICNMFPISLHQIDHGKALFVISLNIVLVFSV